MAAGEEEDSKSIGEHRLHPELFVLVHAVAKKMNIGLIIRSAAAFGARGVVVCGKGHTHSFGSQGTDKSIPTLRFRRVDEAAEWLRERGCRLVGVELVESAKSVVGYPWTGPTALVLGNEGHGLSDELRAVIDDYVYIPQFAPAVASLNVAVAASIVLHHFATWAKYPEAAREDGQEKYVVDIPPSGPERATNPTDADLLRAEVRRRQKEARSSENPEEPS